MISGEVLFPCCHFSVTQSCLALCNPMDYSTPGFPDPHHLLEFARVHVHWISDGIQPSRPLSSPSHPAFNLFWHQGLFQWVNSLHQVIKVLELQHQSFQCIFKVDFLKDWQVWSPYSPRGLSRVFSSTTVQNISCSGLSFLHDPTLTSVHDYWKNQLWLYRPLLARWCLCFLVRCLVLS